jgi:hypothetical protein
MFTATAFSSQDIVRDGLVLWLDANDKTSYPGTGTVWRDLSLGSNNGTLTNGPTFNSNNGGSIVFDGVNDFTNFGNVLNLGTNSATLGAWIKTTANQNYATIIGKAFFGSKPGRYSLHTRSNGALGLITQTGGGNIEVTTAINIINTGNWIYVVGVIDRIFGNMIYVNGQYNSQFVQNSSGQNWSTTDNFTIGFYNGNGSGYFNGSIAMGIFYNRALSPQEILQNYNATKTRYGL